MKNALDEALSAVGGRRQLAEAIGLSVQAVYNWKDRVPAERVPAVEQASGVPRWRLRPDLYPPERERHGRSSVQAKGQSRGAVAGQHAKAGGLSRSRKVPSQRRRAGSVRRIRRLASPPIEGPQGGGETPR